VSAEDPEAPPGSEELVAAVEALVFAAAEPVQAGEIAGALGNLEEAKVEEAIEDLRRYEGDLHRFLESSHPAVLTGIAEKKILDDDVKAALEKALSEFGQRFGAARAAGAAA